MTETLRCDWFAENAGTLPGGETFVDLKCLACGYQKHVSPDIWRGAEALFTDPPECPHDDRQSIMEFD